MKDKTYQAGYIALLSTLIVGAVSLAIASAVLLISIGNRQSTLVTQQAAQVRQAAHGCGEEALLQIQSNTTFTGTGELTIGNANCAYTVANTGGSNRVITATATVRDVVKKVSIYVIITSSSISVSSWQEIS